MLPTPSLTHLTLADYQSIYEPAGKRYILDFNHSLTITEDTFLLMDALELEADDLRSLNPMICLEIGFVRCGY